MRFGRSIILIGLASCATFQPSSTVVKEGEGLSRLRPLLTNPVQVTVGNDANLAPDISFNGRYLAYTTSVNGNKEIEIRDRQKNKQVRLTWHPADDFSPVVNADGSMVAFVTRRRDAAGDIAFVETGGFSSGVLSEREIKVAFKPESEELPPAWWPSKDALLVPVRTDAEAPELQLLKTSDLSWHSWSGIKGEFPNIASGGNLVTYVRKGRIYINDASGSKERELLGLGAGVWTRPQFFADGKSLVAIRYTLDTNDDHLVDGADHGSVWRINLDDSYSTAIGFEQLTSVGSNAYIPKMQQDGLFVTLQAKGSLEIFKFPAAGQGRREWLESKEENWYPFLKDSYEKLFALNFMASSSEKLKQYKDSIQLRIRMMLILKSDFSAPSLTSMASDMRLIYKDDKSVSKLTDVFEKMLAIKEDIAFLKNGGSSLSSKQRLLKVLEELRQSGEASKSLEGSILSKEDLAAVSNIFIAELESALSSYDKAYAALSAISSKTSKRLLAVKNIALAELSGARVSPLQAEEELRSFLKNKNGFDDLDVYAANRFVSLVAQRNLSNEELTRLREAVKDVPRLPPLLHELIAKRFFESGKANIAVQEYRQILEDHCKQDPSVTIGLSKVYVNRSLDHQVSSNKKLDNTDETETALEQLSQCVKANEINFAEANTVRADALVRRGLVLMREREYGAAVKLFRLATQIDSANLNAWRGLIDGLFRRKVLKEELTELDKRARDNPESASAAYAYGYALTYDIDLAKSPRSKIAAIDVAIEKINIAKDLNPSSIFPYQTLGWLYMQRGHWTARYRQEGGVFATVSSGISKVRDLFGRPESNYIELGVDSFHAALFLSEEESIEKANLVQNLGEAYYELENFQKALLYLGERISLSKTHPFADKNVEASVLRLGGRSAFQIEEYELAESLQRKSLEIWQSQANDAQIAYSLEALALTLREQKKYKEAIATYNQLIIRQKAKQQSAQISKTLSNLGYCYYMSDDYVNALENFQESIRKIEGKPETSATQEERAIAVDLGGEASKSKGFDEAALRNMNLTFIARIYQNIGEYDKANFYYQEKINLLTKAPSTAATEKSIQEEIAITYNNKGLSLLESGQLSEAKNSFIEASKISRKLRSDLPYSVEEAINLGAWARLELRLIALGAKTGESMAELKKRLDELMSMYSKETSQDIKTTSKWGPILDRLKLLQQVIELQSSDDSKVRAQLAKNLLDVESEVALAESKASQNNVFELAVLAKDLDLNPKSKAIEEKLKSIQKNIISETVDDQKSWMLNLGPDGYQHRRAVLSKQLSEGYVFKSVYEHQRLLQMSKEELKNLDDKNDPSSEAKKIDVIRWNAFAEMSSWRNSLNYGKNGPVKKDDKTKKPQDFKDLSELIKAVGFDEVLLSVADDGSKVHAVLVDKVTKKYSKYDKPEAVVENLNAQYTRVYLSCYGKRCESIYQLLVKKVKRTSIVASIDQIVSINENRRIALSSVAFLNERDSTQEGLIKKELSSSDITFISSDKWASTVQAVKGSHVTVFAPQLFIGSEAPWAGEFKLKGNASLPISDAVKFGRWSNSAIFLSSLVSRDLAVEAMSVYGFLSVWAEELKVPTVYIKEIALANKETSAQEDSVSMSREISPALSGKVLTTPNGFVCVGDPGLDEKEAVAFATKRLDVVQDLALDAKDAGDIELAKRYFMEALHYAEILKRDKDVLTLNTTLVKTLYQARDYHGAFHFQYRKVEVLKSQNVSPEQLAPMQVEAGILATRSGLGVVARNLLDEASKWYVQDDDQEQLAKIAHYVALSYESDGDYVKTIESYEKSRAIYLKVHKKSEAAQKLLDIGNIYKERLNNYPVALEKYGEAYKEFDAIGEKAKLANVQIDRANTLMAMGETKWAINVLEQRVLNSIDSEDQPVVWARAAQIVANAYFRAGLFQESQGYTDKIKKITPNITDKTTQAMIEIDAENLHAMNQEKLGKHDVATEIFEKALSKSKSFKLKGKEAMILNNIGFWMRENGNYEASLSQFEDALKIDNELKSEADQAYDLRNMAMTLTLLGDLTQAKITGEQALAISSRLKIAHNEAYSLFALAEISLKKKDSEDALKLFVKAREVAEKAYLQDFVWRAFAATASVYASIGKDKEAVEDYSKAVSIIETLRAGLASESSKTGFASDRGVQDVYAGIVQSLMKLSRIEEGWVYSERGRARAFIDALGGRTMSFGNKELDEKIELEKKLRSDVEILERKLALLPADSPDIALVKSQLAKASLDRSQLLDQISQKWPKVISFLGIKPLNLEQALSKLGSSKTLLEYMSLENETAYWVIDDGKISGGLLPISKEKLVGMIGQYRELMQNFAAVQAMARDISNSILVTPLKSVQRNKELVIVPHGQMHYLPFSSLPINGKFLLDEFPITYLESAEMLRFSVKDPKSLSQNSSIAAFGNPDRGPDLNLPFAEREVNAIKRKFPNAETIFGSQATKAKFKEAVQKVDIAHFAGHGEFVDQDPSASRLLFAGTDDLTVKEIFELKLPVALITLSACETGLGKLSSGDEIVGFNRALFFAGAESIISSLWRVSDVASSVTVKRFYDEISKGEGRAVALQKAQVLVRKYFSHPAYWSAFKLSGEGK